MRVAALILLCAAASGCWLDKEPHPAPPADCAEWFCQEDHAGNIRACECLD